MWHSFVLHASGRKFLWRVTFPIVYWNNRIEKYSYLAFFIWHVRKTVKSDHNFVARARVCLCVCVCVCLSVCLGSHWMDCHEIWYLSIFRKSVKKIQVSLKSNKHTELFTWRPMYIYDTISLYSEMFQTNVVEKIKTHILRSVIFL